MKKLIPLILLMASSVLALKAEITLWNPGDELIVVDLVRGHIFPSDQLGSNTQGVIIDENKRVYIPAKRYATFYVKVRCYQSYRPSPPPGTPIHPSPFFLPDGYIPNPTGSIDSDIKKAKKNARKIRANRDRGNINN